MQPALPRRSAAAGHASDTQGTPEISESLAMSLSMSMTPFQGIVGDQMDSSDSCVFRFCDKPELIDSKTC